VEELKQYIGVQTKNNQMLGFNLKKIKVPKVKAIYLGMALPQKKDYAKSMNVFNKTIREPVSAKIRHKILERDKHKYRYLNCHEKEILDTHHLDMNPSNNKLSNLKTLCPTHHRKAHQNYKRIDEKDLMGRRISSKVVPKNKVKEYKITLKKKQFPGPFI